MGTIRQFQDQSMIWRRAGSRRGGTIVDLVAVVGVIAALVALLIPMLLTARERSGRTHCMVSLRKIGYALREYADANRGFLPVVQLKGLDSDEVAASASARQTAEVPTAFLVLLKTQRLSPSALICPNAEDQVELTVTPRGASTFDYALHAAAAVTSADPWRWTSDLPSTFALAADRGPGFVGGELVVSELDSSSGLLGMENSRNHGRRGQNILYADGHVEFRTTPLAGVNEDHIYRSTEGTLANADVGTNTAKDDSLLLPVEE